jgi:hypothetical protein
MIKLSGDEKDQIGRHADKFISFLNHKKDERAWLERKYLFYGCKESHEIAEDIVGIVLFNMD